ncbi:kinesin family member 1 [Paragonimus westermani]|uniref:Kinesin family member 1 n=1 Tax=Paragonimus westermani TaxID=34504 RepID=A0A5J4NMG7_9TREM|nr:kinesin family member 1 [Paragonimus westermani]
MHPFEITCSGSMTESIDWTYAICELLDKQGVDLRKEMEERLLEIEAQFRRERDASDRLFEEQKREYEDRIQSLQEQVERQSMLSSITQDDQMLIDDETTSECTWSEREFQLASWAFDKWRTHQFTSLRDQLWENAVYLKEANALSVELNKNVRFQFTLLTDTPFSPLPPDFNQSCNASPTVVDRENFDSNTTPQPKRPGVVLSSAMVPSQQTVNELALFRSDEKHMRIKSQRHTMVAIKVQDILSGAVHYWSLERFRKRLSRMREHYEQQTDFAVLSCSEDNMESRTIRSSSNEISEKPNRLGEDDEKEIRDPFQARDPWFRLIGRCFVYLSNLLFETNLVQRVAIVNHHGQVSGFICVAIELTAGCSPVDASTCKSEDNEAVSSVLTTPIVFDNRAYVDWLSDHQMSEIGHLMCEEELNFTDPEVLPADVITPRPNENNYPQRNGQMPDVSEPLESQKVNGPRNQFFPQKTLTENAGLVDAVLRETLVDVDGELYGTLKLGSELTFRVTVLQMTGVSTEFTEVFCQYFFQHRPNEIFCTKPMKNSPDSELVGFYHAQQIRLLLAMTTLDISNCSLNSSLTMTNLFLLQFTTTVTLAFLDYVRHHPLGFEIYGHVSDTSNSAALESQSTIALPRRFSNFIPSSLSASTPVPPTRLNKTESPSDLFLVHSEDILVWFEILEINANGDHVLVPLTTVNVRVSFFFPASYAPVPVDRLDEPPCQGAFLIHQGLQRRLAVTLVYDSTAPDTLDPITSITTPPTLFQDVYEVVVGRVRDTPDWLESDSETRILSLSLFPVRYLPQAGDDRTFFRFEAAWDSSLHASSLLNRVTKPGHRVFMTISCYLDVDGCTRPVCLTKDIAMVVFPREAKLSVASPRLTHNPTNALLRSVQSLWTSFCRVAQTSRVSAVYELLLRRPWVTRDNGHRTRPVMDSSLMYVRGEENLKGWRPRGDSLIIEHQWELDRLDRIKLVSADQIDHHIKVRVFTSHFLDFK